MSSHRKIVVTGASGFIGSHLCEYFHNNGDEVYACVNETNHKLLAKEQHVFHFPDIKFKTFLKENKPDFLLHCAGSASVSESFKNSQNDFNQNVVVTHFILDAIKDYSPHTKIIFFSSAAVYGNPIELPIKTTTPTNPISPYGYHKLMCEIICEKSYSLSNIPVTILRIFSVYGPGLKKQILWDILQKIKNSETLVLFGTGKETRDFIYIKDLIKTVANVINKSEFNGNIINVASGKAITIEHLAQTLLRTLKLAIPLKFTGETKAGDHLSWRIDQNTLDAKLINEFTSLEDGITNYINWIANEATAL